MTRQEYLAAACAEGSHRTYYSQFVDVRVRELVLRVMGLERLRASKDPHFNDIPLASWDFGVSLLPAAVPARMRELGDYLTKAGGVCVLKEAARQLVDGGAS